ncbi:hypothetical protein F6V25_03685 [Oryzomonas japonica]|uniref:Big-1 domain-containing protein n=1 Tax=Oryzomonas japonica TaxID=2603858 RepID=A0A7J4ZSZ6_9BACT|nr:hypothetical protein [Oryzomonas japonica]KAB0666531.1 hypothetical protein F6V25_03685 [Oryzomonas japonica]
MRYLIRLLPCILLMSSLALAGCGGSNAGTNSSASDQFSTGSSSGSGTGTSAAGVIMFTDTASSQPGSQTNMLTEFTKTVNPAVTPIIGVYQPIPFKLTDSKGNPRVGTPVTMYVYSITTRNPNDVTVGFLVPTTISGTVTAPNPETNQQTITTDSAGMGIFNVVVDIVSPPVDAFTTVTVVYKAVTNDSVPVTAYVGQLYHLDSTANALTLTPSSQHFAASDGVNAMLTFAISGGVAPYTVSSSNTGLVTATRTDATTLTATLVDADSWSNTVTVSVTDSSGLSASSTITRQ